MSLQNYSRQTTTCSGIKCPKCHKPKLKRVVLSLSLPFFFFSPFFFILIFILGWLSIISAINTAAGWTGLLYNLADTTVSLHGTAWRSRQIFMPPQICHLPMALSLLNAKGCRLVLLKGKWSSHPLPNILQCFQISCLILGITDNNLKLTPRVLWQVFVSYTFCSLVTFCLLLCLTLLVHTPIWGVSA